MEDIDRMLHLAKKIDVSARRRSKIQEILEVENSGAPCLIVPREEVASLEMLLSTLSLLLMGEKRRAVRKAVVRKEKIESRTLCEKRRAMDRVGSWEVCWDKNRVSIGLNHFAKQTVLVETCNEGNSRLVCIWGLKRICKYVLVL